VLLFNARVVSGRFLLTLFTFRETSFIRLFIMIDKRPLYYKFAPLCFALFLTVLSPDISTALPDAAYISFTLENDLFTTSNRDRHYTNGFRFSLISDTYSDFTEKNSSAGMRKIFGQMDFVREEGYQRWIAYGGGQIISTPEDVAKIVDQPDDLPYAGLLYWFYTMNGEKKKQGESLTLMVGIIGPLSMAEHVQKLAHKVSDSDRPRGWDNQLKNELALNIGYDRRYLLYSHHPRKRWSFDIVGTGALYLGNVITGGNVSFAAVLGKEDSFNPLSIRPDLIGRGTIAANGSRRPGPFVLVGVGTDIYVHSVFLDGNLFRDGPHVDKKPFVHNLFAGFGYNWLDFSAHIGWIDQGKMFDGQDGGLEYGTINFTWRN